MGERTVNHYFCIADILTYFSRYDRAELLQRQALLAVFFYCFQFGISQVMQQYLIEIER